MIKGTKTMDTSLLTMDPHKHRVFWDALIHEAQVAREG